MSGPKDYSPPPSYSLSVFEGKLNQVFQLQARLKMLCDEIGNLNVTDTELNIHLDCTSDLKKLESNVSGALKALVFDYKGTFGQETYNRIDREIGSRIVELNKSLESCQAIRMNFSDKRKDYQSYRSYLQFYDTSKASFGEFKSNIQNYLKTNLEEKAPEILRDATEQIGEINFEKTASAFKIGFTSRMENEKGLLVTHSVEKENQINAVRAMVSDRVIEKFQETAVKIETANNSVSTKSDEQREVSERIEALLRNWEDELARGEFEGTFRKLSASESLADTYFFKELHDSILDEMRIRRTKDDLNALLGDLNGLSVHSTVIVDKQNIISSCIRAINSSSADDKDLKNLQSRVEDLRDRSHHLQVEDEIRRKEKLFLKSQLVLCLENLGYDVLDDMNVMDFEQENDFLFKVNRQDNYLNLKFKEDGSIRYVFQIPEEEDELSTDQKNMKLHEMKVTCDEFRTVLSDLSKMGLKVDLRSERPIGVDSLITVPKNRRDRIKPKQGRKDEKQTIRKKYLGQ